MSMNANLCIQLSIWYLTRMWNEYLKPNMEKWSSLTFASPIIFSILVNGNSIFRDDRVKSLEGYFLMLFFLLYRLST